MCMLIIRDYVVLEFFYFSKLNFGFCLSRLYVQDGTHILISTIFKQRHSPLPPPEHL